MHFFKPPLGHSFLVRWKDRLQSKGPGRSLRNKSGNARRGKRPQVAYESLEPRTLLATLVANYASDFPLPGEQPSGGWQYQWNAPEQGDPGSGSIDDPATKFLPLQFTGIGTNWTPDGDLIPGNNPTSAYVRLTAFGGHPGVGEGVITPDVARYAIASFTVSESGFYEITDSFIGLNPFNPFAFTDGVEFRVFVNHDSPVDSGVVDKDSRPILTLRWAS